MDYFIGEVIKIINELQFPSKLTNTGCKRLSIAVFQVENQKCTATGGGWEKFVKNFTHVVKTPVTFR